MGNSDGDVVIYWLIASSCTAVMVWAYMLHRVPQKPDTRFIESCRLFVVMNHYDTILELIVGMASLWSSALYIWDTYIGQPPLWMQVAEVINAVIFGFNYLTLLFLARRRVMFMANWLSLIDVVTVVPVVLAAATRTELESRLSFLRFGRILRLSKLLRLVRVLRTMPIFAFFATPPSAESPGSEVIGNQVVQLILTLMFMVVLMTGFTQFLAEWEHNEYGADEEDWADGDRPRFHDYLYFTIVTFSTVGYGDLAPPTAISRVVVMIVICIFLVIVPKETSTLVGLMELRSKYAGSVASKHVGTHIVVATRGGTQSMVMTFLTEFFHEDHGMRFAHVVLIVPEEPNLAWKNIILQFASKDQLTYLNGDIMNSVDLRRARAREAKACFILANRQSSDSAREDALNLIRALTVRQFARDRLLFLEVAHARNALGYRNLECDDKNTVILSASVIKMRMLAMEVMHPGFSTFLSNLVLSMADDFLESTRGVLPEAYREGCGKEIYRIALGDYAHGYTYKRALTFLLKRHRTLLLGLFKPSAPGSLRMHPGNKYIIQKEDYAVVMAADVEEAQILLPQALQQGASRRLPWKTQLGESLRTIFTREGSNEHPVSDDARASDLHTHDEHSPTSSASNAQQKGPAGDSSGNESGYSRRAHRRRRRHKRRATRRRHTTGSLSGHHGHSHRPHDRHRPSSSQTTTTSASTSTSWNRGGGNTATDHGAVPSAAYTSLELRRYPDPAALLGAQSDDSSPVLGNVSQDSKEGHFPEEEGPSQPPQQMEDDSSSRTSLKRSSSLHRVVSGKPFQREASARLNAASRREVRAATQEANPRCGTESDDGGGGSNGGGSAGAGDGAGDNIDSDRMSVPSATGSSSGPAQLPVEANTADTRALWTETNTIADADRRPKATASELETETVPERLPPLPPAISESRTIDTTTGDSMHQIPHGGSGRSSFGHSRSRGSSSYHTSLTEQEQRRHAIMQYITPISTAPRDMLATGITQGSRRRSLFSVHATGSRRRVMSSPRYDARLRAAQQAHGEPPIQQRPHIVLITQMLDDIDIFIESISAPIFKKTKITVVCPEVRIRPRQLRMWNTLLRIYRRTHRLRLVEGTPSHEHIVDAAGMADASAIVYLSNGDTEFGTASADSDMLPLCLQVLSKNQKGNVARMIFDVSSTAYVDHLSLLLAYQANEEHRGTSGNLVHHIVSSPAYMRGDVVLSDTAERIMCQAFFEPAVAEVANALLSAAHPKRALRNPTQFITAVLTGIVMDEYADDLLRPYGWESGDCYGDLMDILIHEFDALPLAVFFDHGAVAHSTLQTGGPSNRRGSLTRSDVGDSDSSDDDMSSSSSDSDDSKSGSDGAGSSYSSEHSSAGRSEFSDEAASEDFDGAEVVESTPTESQKRRLERRRRRQRRRAKALAAQRAAEQRWLGVESTDTSAPIDPQQKTVRGRIRQGWAKLCSCCSGPLNIGDVNALPWEVATQSDKDLPKVDRKRQLPPTTAANPPSEVPIQHGDIVYLFTREVESFERLKGLRLRWSQEDRGVSSVVGYRPLQEDSTEMETPSDSTVSSTHGQRSGAALFQNLQSRRAEDGDVSDDDADDSMEVAIWDDGGVDTQADFDANDGPLTPGSRVEFEGGNRTPTSVSSDRPIEHFPGPSPCGARGHGTNGRAAQNLQQQQRQLRLQRQREDSARAATSRATQQQPTRRGRMGRASVL